ncbi:protein Cep89 homolog [Sitodiplosis mosellana]|uniref:protein Cep89 homolog n=1 Tax=Sitodiplosis mosellana TaxID=263140 RepID=UPI002443B9A8|nr:protein Cep89 homolog [Sitodiplosis mosellana]
MTSKSTINHASVDVNQLKDVVETKKVSRKSSESKHSKGRRSQSLDRVLDDNSGDSREERRNRRQFMHLISEKNEQIEKLMKRVTTLHSLNNEFAIEHEKLETELQEFQQRCADYEAEREKGCDSCRSLAKQNKEHQLEIDRLANESEQLVSDINMMKVLIYRLNVQLENYQEMLRKQDNDGKPSARTRNHHHAGHETISTINYENITSIDWGCVQSHVLAPLLNAYQETIREKMNLVKQYEAELNQMTGRIKDILTENEALCTQIEQMKQYSDTWTAEKVQLKAQLDACRKKAEIHSKSGDLAKEKLMEVMRYYEQKIQSQSIDIQRLQEAYGRLKGEQSNCKTMHEQPELVIERLKECQRLFDETKAQYEVEKNKLNDEINALKEMNQKIEVESQSFKLRITEQNSVIDLQKEKLGKFEKKLEKLRHKFLRLRQSREVIKSRLRSAITWNRKIEAAAKTISWQDLRKIEQMLIQKDYQLQQFRIQHQNEMEKLQRKLSRRDELLRKLLLNKVKKK